MKSNQVIKCTVDAEARTLTFEVRGAGETALHLDKVHPDMLAYAALHGFKQRVSDAAAIPCDTATGQSASPDDKLAAMVRMVEHYESGAAEWAVAREGGGGGRVSYLVEALMAVKGVDEDRARAFVKGLTKAERAAVEATGEIKAYIDKRRAESGKAVDAGALLQGLLESRPDSSL